MKLKSRRASISWPPTHLGSCSAEGSGSDEPAKSRGRRRRHRCRSPEPGARAGPLLAAAPPHPPWRSRRLEKRTVHEMTTQAASREEEENKKRRRGQERGSESFLGHLGCRRHRAPPSSASPTSATGRDRSHPLAHCPPSQSTAGASAENRAPHGQSIELLVGVPNSDARAGTQEHKQPCAYDGEETRTGGGIRVAEEGERHYIELVVASWGAWSCAAARFLPRRRGMVTEIETVGCFFFFFLFVLTRGEMWHMF